MSTLLTQPAFLFLAGVHGSGKTSMCGMVFQPAGFHCASASSIIRNANGEVSASKHVSNVDSNQQKLLAGLSVLKQNHPLLLIDGHFAVVRADRTIALIEPEVFCAMAPDAVIIMKAEPEIIAERLASRDGQVWPIDFISEFQACEIEHAKKVTDAINVSLHVIESKEEAVRLLPLIISNLQ
jgi:adenylate kinase